MCPEGPALRAGSRGTIKTKFPLREAPACGRGASQQTTCYLPQTMSVVNLLILRWVAFTGAEAISIVFSHPSTAGSQIFRKSSESRPRASRLDAPSSCCRGGEESRPCNHNYISRKPRSVSGELHLPCSLPPVQQSLKRGEGQNLFTIVNRLRKNCTVPYCK